MALINCKSFIAFPSRKTGRSFCEYDGSSLRPAPFQSIISIRTQYSERRARDIVEERRADQSTDTLLDLR
jgi:hypothetical protein